MRWTALVLFSLILLAAQAQDTTGVNRKRLYLTLGIGGAGYVGSLVALNEVWYKDHPRQAFHSFNDNGEWLQLDKMGHALTSYELGRAGHDAFRWCGLRPKQSLFFGGMLGATYLTTLEVLDGFAEGWGFSWGDAAANFSGSAVYIGQELLWQEQRIKPKFSVHLTDYAAIRPGVLGEGFAQRIFKDYNGQTYWLSANIKSFLNPESRFPGWLNVAVGFGGEEMLVGDKPGYITCTGNDCDSYTRYRQYYLSLDVDLTRLKIRSPLLRSITKAFGFIKVPFPALELNVNGVQGHWLYF